MSDKEKPKIAFYWCSSCGGCEESVVDLAEDLLDVIAAVDIVFWPVAMDFKKKDVEAMEDGSILATMINGAVRTSEQKEMAQLLRRKSQLIIAYGSCAHSGGVIALANQFNKEQILQFIYHDAPSVINEENTRPQTEFKEEGRESTLPAFHNMVRSLDQVIDVDYIIPGCAPTLKILKKALEVLLSGNLPEKGMVLAPDKALCDECPRIDGKPEDLSLTEFKRPHQILIDPGKCFLTQGLVCMGPATRGGCESLCINGNMPCTGCFGPTSRVKDHGAKALSFISSSISANDQDQIDQILSGIPDPVGTFYRYSLARSFLKRKVDLNDTA